MPIDLVIPLAKAAVKDEDKMILLEDEIKDALEQDAGPEKTLSVSGSYRSTHGTKRKRL